MHDIFTMIVEKYFSDCTYIMTMLRLFFCQVLSGLLSVTDLRSSAVVAAVRVLFLNLTLDRHLVSSHRTALKSCFIK